VQPGLGRDIYTVAGTGIPGLSGDGHAATGAELDEPAGVGVNQAGNLLVADVGDGRCERYRAERPRATPLGPGCWPRGVARKMS